MIHPAWLRSFATSSLFLMLCGCGPDREAAQGLLVRGPAMGAEYAVEVVAPPPHLDEAVLRGEIERQLAAIEHRFSTYRPDSELSRLNAGPGGTWISATPELVSVLAAGQEISRLSGGAFDMTVKPLTDLWGFGGLPGAERVPAAAEIAAARKSTGAGLLEWRHEPPALRKARAELRLDVNGIVPGHAADLIAARLESLGVSDYRVDLGGEMRLRGRSAKGRPWRIAIENPSVAGDAQGWFIEPGDAAVSTSGSYRNFFEVNGQRYSHMIDPRSGYPVRHPLASVTVIAPSALQADAWSTALLVLGRKAGPARARELGLAALFVSQQNGGSFELQSTPGFPALRERGKAP